MRYNNKVIDAKTTKLILARNLPKALTRDIDKAKRRVLITTTTLHNDCPEMELLISALETAARRGIDVSVLADSLTYTEIRGSIFNIKKQQLRGLKAMQLERRLKKSGAQFRWLGHDANIGFIGRTHCKWFIVDDIEYSFGGINLDATSFTNVDYMLRIIHPDLANFIADAHQHIMARDQAKGGLRNLSLTSKDGSTTVFIDGGMPLNSLIYKRATTIAQNSTDLTIVSQYCPTGALMKAVYNCPKHRVFFNKIKNATLLNSILLSLGWRHVQKNSYQLDDYLHAKFILSSQKDGKTVALLGSHNFMRSSGLVGTREIAMETSDPHVISLLSKFVDNQVVR